METPARTMTKTARVNGWILLFHPAFLDQLEALTGKIERAKAKDTTGFRKKASTKQLAAIRTLVYETIPADPGQSHHRQGNTLGTRQKRWFYVKFLQHHRLFYRYDSTVRIIIVAWVNDEMTQWAVGEKTDAYAVFSRMLDSGNSPDDWDGLRQESVGRSV